MKVRFFALDPANDHLLAGHRADGSGVGINYIDATMKPVRLTLEDGRKVTFKRRGLKLTLTIGDKSGDGLLRRLANGPSEKKMFRAALTEAARNAGAELVTEGDVCYLEV